MLYGNELKKQLKEEKNIVNKMYLNEIQLQYNKFARALLADSTDEDYYESLASALTSFTSQLESPKYFFNKSTKAGFRRNSLIMAPSYLDDYVYSIFKRQQILKNKGIHWGKQSFTMNMKFDASTPFNVEKDLELYFKESSAFLQLAQQVDLQFRVSGKKKFEKYNIFLPLISFFITKRLYSDDLARIEYYAKGAKRAFIKSKMMVICETIDSGFTHDDLPPSVDIIFVLRKRKKGKRSGIIHADVLKSISDTIEKYLYESNSETFNYEQTGIIK